ncbi:hypothetical protein C0068_06920 [Zhongshania marina]|uniref:Uncharacterized protein n=1 Tax=Zhongshania marina TaxID=2304603 RepID=A0A2S4HH97_9GAMM|nr:hypothetical protein C0068_06920 [Marortus luteolus]
MLAITSSSATRAYVVIERKETNAKMGSFYKIGLPSQLDETRNWFENNHRDFKYDTLYRQQPHQ